MRHLKQIPALVVSIILSTALLSAQQQGSQTDPKAKAIIEKTIAKFRQTPVKVTFTLTIEDSKTESKDVFKGDFALKDDKFKIVLPQAHTYYDGKTEYVHLIKGNEVSISTPTKEEIQELNPAFILINSTKRSTIQFSLDDKASLSYYTVDIFPYYGDKKNYYKAIAKIDRKTSALISIKIMSKNGIQSTLQVNKFEPVKNYADSFFAFDFKANPKVVVNDLR